MKLRTKLMLAFLLLAVVPLVGIVLYTYQSSQSALREAVEAEAEVLASEVGERLEAVRSDVDRRIKGLSAMPLQSLAMGGDLGDPEILRKVVEAIGDAAPLFRSLEYLPAGEAAGDVVGSGVTVLLAADEDNAYECEAMVVDHRDPTVQRKFRYRGGANPILLAEQTIEVAVRLGSEMAALRSLSARVPGPASTRRPLPPLVRRHLEEARKHLFLASARPGFPIEHFRLFAKENLSGDVWDGDEVIGTVHVEIDPQALLGRVLSATRRDRGEIPFALDSEGDLFTLDTADKELLEEIEIARVVGASGDDRTVATGNWVIVTNRDSVSGVIFGIARPIGEPLAEIRRSAARNLGYGMGMIGFALLGIIPFSKRMTRDLSRLSSGVEQLAGGDLGARVEARGSDEISALAQGFNRMAEQLDEDQRRLLDQERARRKEEVERNLLEAENSRKTQELEEARLFQLSLLPGTVPDDPRFLVAALMKTATEVGGDYYDFSTSEGGALTVAVGDATGHGATAATMVTVIKSLFTAADDDSSPAAFLDSAARTIRRMRLGRRNMALTLARLEDGAAVIASAGMPPVLLHRATEPAISEVAFEALPLGRLVGDAYEERRLELASGDTLLFMTDGLPELQNADGEIMGYERVLEIFHRCAEDDPESIVACLEGEAYDWLGGRPAEDDFTFVVVRVV